jgi:glyoxylase-like metal-dependent hydrolase (beta-lactamase superfamily II)/ferredoxin
MARADLRLSTNVDGEFYVDSSCIDCDACRQIAPATFRESDGQSSVYQQPADDDEALRAEMALITCPTSSIGTVRKRDLSRAVAALPEEVAPGIYRCGYASESSFGAISWLVQRPEGNLLIDSPRFTLPLVRRLEALGGVRRMLLTNRDDVADHERFAEHFGCERVLHRDDVTARTSAVEVQPSGDEAIEIQRGVMMIPVPGHTRGHAVFLVDDTWLFTGDHLAWNVRRDTLYAFRNACWYSWPRQIESMERLLDYSFAAVFPGHGRPMQLTRERMHAELVRCVEWMKR